MKVLYDGDPAGLKAALRGLDIIIEQDMNVRLVLLPEGEDPDSFLQNTGKTAFTEFLEENSKDFVLFKAELLRDEAQGDPIKKAALIKDIINSIALVPDPLKRSIYIQHCSQLIQIAEPVLNNEVNKSIKGNLKKKRIQAERQPILEPDEKFVAGKLKDHNQKPIELSTQYKERDIIRILLSHGQQIYNEEKNVSVAQYLILNIESILDEFENKHYQAIILESIELLKKNNFSVNHFLSHQDPFIQGLAIDIVTSPYEYAEWEGKGVLLQTQKRPEENFEKDSYQAVLRLKLDKIKKMIDSIKLEILELKKNAPDSEDYQYAIRALQQLLSERNDIANELNTVVF